MKVIKRNGTEVVFDITKIIAAITKANDVVEENERMTPMQIQRIAESVELACQKMNRSPSVEEIQDLVEKQIMAHGAFEVAKRYITYRYTRSLVRRSNTTDEKILSLIECCNEEAKQENSNKNPVVNSTQRDYMAGEVSRDITNRILLPPRQHLHLPQPHIARAQRNEVNRLHQQLRLPAEHILRPSRKPSVVQVRQVQPRRTVQHRQHLARHHRKQAVRRRLRPQTAANGKKQKQNQRKTLHRPQK